jgi:arabinogalactan oligomer/maltooligosaccharide transport system substrate-binding protein
MAMRAAAEDAIPMPNAPQMDVMWTTAGRMLTEIFMNGADIVTATNDAQEESLDLIELME